MRIRAVGIAEPGHRPAPVRLVAEPGDLVPGDALPPLNEPRAATAGDDLGGQVGQGRPSIEGRVGHYFSRSLSSRRDTTSSPPMPITARYRTLKIALGPTSPTAIERSRSTPW